MVHHRDYNCTYSTQVFCFFNAVYGGCSHEYLLCHSSFPGLLKLPGGKQQRYAESRQAGNGITYLGMDRYSLPVTFFIILYRMETGDNKDLT